MNLDELKIRLAENGWKNLNEGEQYGIGFELIGERRYLGTTKWNIYVKNIEILDNTTLEVWKNNFHLISEKSKSYLWGKCFILLLIANNVEPKLRKQLLESIDSFGLFGMLRMKGGGGNIFVADISCNNIYGKVPKIPLDVHKMSKSSKEILQNVINLYKDNWKPYKGGWGLFVEGGSEIDHISITNKMAKVGDGFHISIGEIKIYFDKSGNYLGEGIDTHKLLEKLNGFKERGIVSESEYNDTLFKIAELKKNEGINI